MRSLLFFLAVLFFSCGNNEAPTKEVLFIGNSLTYYNEMPKKLQGLLDEAGAKFHISQSTYPGFSLDAHLNSIILGEMDEGLATRKKKEGETTKTVAKLKSSRYDIIILQEGTGKMLIPEYRVQKTIPAIAAIKQLAGKDSKILFYQNYPTNQAFPKKFCENIGSRGNKQEYCSDTINNLEGEMRLISNIFNDLDIPTVKIGQSFYDNILATKQNDLYQDETHPSETGSLLIAQLFFKEITENNY